MNRRFADNIAAVRLINPSSLANNEDPKKLDAGTRQRITLHTRQSFLEPKFLNGSSTRNLQAAGI